MTEPAELKRAKKSLERFGLCAVPLPAAELIARSVDMRLELDRCSRLLRDTAEGQGDSSMADMIAVLQHRLTLEQERRDAAETALRARLRGEIATREVEAWRKATHQQARKSA